NAVLEASTRFGGPEIEAERRRIAKLRQLAMLNAKKVQSAADRTEQERLAREKAERERLEQLAREKAERERQEKLEKERIEKEKREKREKTIFYIAVAVLVLVVAAFLLRH
ncbi:MAG: hypothetical protein Q4D81_11515, partial [Eubacteriales bacterium]|nr:hypothetical protein [Eubacteriales bacterium]